MRSDATHSKETLRGMKKRFLIFLLGISVSSIGCHSRVMTEEQQFKTLFDGYQLLVVGDLPKGGSLEDDDTLTLRSAYPIESKLIPGRAYSFRKTNHLSNDTLALKIFPERLSSIGARITKAPHSAKDLMDLVIGGPLFNIEFEKDGHQGKIFNRAHTSDKINSNWEELILLYK